MLSVSQNFQKIVLEIRRGWGLDSFLKVDRTNFDFVGQLRDPHSFAKEHVRNSVKFTLVKLLVCSALSG